MSDTYNSSWLISNFSLWDLARKFHTISSLLIKVADKIRPMTYLVYQKVRKGWNIPACMLINSACAGTSCRASAVRAQHKAQHSVPALAFHSKKHPEVFGQVYATATCPKQSQGCGSLWNKLNWLCNIHSTGGVDSVEKNTFHRKKGKQPL